MVMTIKKMLFILAAVLAIAIGLYPLVFLGMGLEFLENIVLYLLQELISGLCNDARSGERRTLWEAFGKHTCFICIG